MKPRNVLPEMELRRLVHVCPVISEEEAVRAGYASVTMPVDIYAEAELVQKLDRGMRGAKAAWVMMAGPWAELWRDRRELRDSREEESRNHNRGADKSLAGLVRVNPRSREGGAE